MKRPKLPELDTTERRYLNDTAHARLASPGIQRFPPRRGGVGGKVVAAAVLLALLVGAMFLLASR
jgi:hypothetical protein